MTASGASTWSSAKHWKPSRWSCAASERPTERGTDLGAVERWRVLVEGVQVGQSRHIDAVLLGQLATEGVVVLLVLAQDRLTDQIGAVRDHRLASWPG